jgi:hypothetical protein
MAHGKATKGEARGHERCVSCWGVSCRKIFMILERTEQYGPLVLYGIRRGVARRGVGAECCWRFQNWVIQDSGAARSVRPVVLHGLRRDAARRGAGAEPDDPCCWRVQNRMISVSGATRTVRFVVLQELDMRWTARLRIGGYNPMIRVAGDSRTG